MVVLALPLLLDAGKSSVHDVDTILDI